MIDHKTLRIGQSGFSIVELLIVLIIVSILAAVGAPIYRGNIDKAKMSEADGTLAVIRNRLRIIYAENTPSSYPISAARTQITDVSWLTLQPGEFDGQYFSEDDYSYLCADGENYQIFCANAEILESDRIMDQDGTLNGGM